MWKQEIPIPAMSANTEQVTTAVRGWLQEFARRTFHDTETMVKLFATELPGNTQALQNMLNGSVLFVFLRMVEKHQPILESLLETRFRVDDLRRVVVRQVIHEDVVQNTFGNQSAVKGTPPRQALRLAKGLIQDIAEATLEAMMESRHASKPASKI